MLKAMSDWFGYSEKDMHDLLTYKFLFEMKKVNGESVAYFLQVDEMTQGQFDKYIESIKNWAWGFGFHLQLWCNCHSDASRRQQLLGHHGHGLVEFHATDQEVTGN